MCVCVCVCECVSVCVCVCVFHSLSFCSLCIMPCMCVCDFLVCMCVCSFIVAVEEWCSLTGGDSGGWVPGSNPMLTSKIHGKPRLACDSVSHPSSKTEMDLLSWTYRRQEMWLFLQKDQKTSYEAAITWGFAFRRS